MDARQDFLGEDQVSPASATMLSGWLQAVVGPLWQKSQKPCNQSPPFCHVGVFLPAADRSENLLARNIHWGDPEESIALRHGGIDESRLDIGDVDGEFLLGDLVSQRLQVPSNECLRRPIGGSTSIRLDAGDRRDSDEMAAAPCDEVSHRHAGHRCEAIHIAHSSFPFIRRNPSLGMGLGVRLCPSPKSSKNN